MTANLDKVVYHNEIQILNEKFILNSLNAGITGLVIGYKNPKQNLQSPVQFDISSIEDFFKYIFVAFSIFFPRLRSLLLASRQPA